MTQATIGNFLGGTHNQTSPFRLLNRKRGRKRNFFTRAVNGISSFVSDEVGSFKSYVSNGIESLRTRKAQSDYTTRIDQMVGDTRALTTLEIERRINPYKPMVDRNEATMNRHADRLGATSRDGLNTLQAAADHPETLLEESVDLLARQYSWEKIPQQPKRNLGIHVPEDFDKDAVPEMQRSISRVLGDPKTRRWMQRETQAFQNARTQYMQQVNERASRRKPRFADYLGWLKPLAASAFSAALLLTTQPSHQQDISFKPSKSQEPVVEYQLQNETTPTYSSPIQSLEQAVSAPTGNELTITGFTENPIGVMYKSDIHQSPEGDYTITPGKVATNKNEREPIGYVINIVDPRGKRVSQYTIGSKESVTVPQSSVQQGSKAQIGAITPAGKIGVSAVHSFPPNTANQTLVYSGTRR